MTLEDYRFECNWSKNEMAREAKIDFSTLQRALTGESISARTADKLAFAISKKLGRPVRAGDIEGLNIAS
jgi:transcriptional regulator with XRE-family HTH domain